MKEGSGEEQKREGKRERGRERERERGEEKEQDRVVGKSRKLYKKLH